MWKEMCVEFFFAHKRQKREKEKSIIKSDLKPRENFSPDGSFPCSCNGMNTFTQKKNTEDDDDDGNIIKYSSYMRTVSFTCNLSRFALLCTHTICAVMGDWRRCTYTYEYSHPKITR